MDIVHKNEMMIINNLYDVILDKDIKEISKHLNEFNKDIINHFSFEEQIMQKYNYKKYEYHKEAHKNIYKKFKKEYDYWFKNIDLKRLKDYLKNSLSYEYMNHI